MINLIDSQSNGGSGLLWNDGSNEQLIGGHFLTTFNFEVILESKHEYPALPLNVLFESAL